MIKRRFGTRRTLARRASVLALAVAAFAAASWSDSGLAGAEPAAEFPDSLRRSAPVRDPSEAVVFTMNEGSPTPYALDLARRSGTDMLIRGWFKWCYALPLEPEVPAQAHRLGALFGGGITCSVVYEGENGLSLEQVSDFATRGIDGQLVIWPPGATRKPPVGHHGTLSNPAYLEYLLRWCRLQIDAGVDSLFMDECDGALLPNEGYDDYSIKDFARFLLESYPETKGWAADDTRWQTRYQIALKDPAVCPDGSITSFKYRAYLGAGKLSAGDPRDPLAPAWKAARAWRDDRAWKLLTDRIRAYATEKGRRVTICGNGLYPYVDLQVTNNWKEDEQIEKRGRIDLTENRMPSWRHQVVRGQALAKARVPVVVFHDWGATLPWMAASPEERRVWMRTRGAEIYAAGGFFAFPVLGPYGCDAGKDGTLDTIVREASFYQAHRDRYLHGRYLGRSAVRTETPDLSLALWSADEGRTLLVHVINRRYCGGKLELRQNVELELPLADLPISADASSPDWSGSRPVVYSLLAGNLRTMITDLDAHALLELHFAQPIDAATLSKLTDPD